jgi:hypothetical protein
MRVVPVRVPALRERPQDIKPLAQYFLDDFCASNNFKPKTLDESVYTGQGWLSRRAATRGWNRSSLARRLPVHAGARFPHAGWNAPACSSTAGSTLSRLSGFSRKWKATGRVASTGYAMAPCPEIITAGERRVTPRLRR